MQSNFFHLSVFSLAILLSAAFAPATLASLSPYVLGPNIEVEAYSALSPASPKGAFIPQGKTSFAFSWFEPLNESAYGTWKNNKTRYLRFLAGAELSPFYGTFRTAVGFAPLPAPFSILEFRFIYENENLLWSDVEQALMPNDSPQINETWNGNYIFDRFYNKSSYAQIQSFGSELRGRYIARNFELAFVFNFTLIDINSDYEKKSFDYMRGIPLYSRDYVIFEKLSAIFHFSERLSFETEFTSLQSGKRFKFFADKNFTNYHKQSLSAHTLFAGLMWSASDRKSYVSLKPGWFFRDENQSKSSGSFVDEFLISLQYRRFWNFDFGKK